MPKISFAKGALPYHYLNLNAGGGLTLQAGVPLEIDESILDELHLELSSQIVRTTKTGAGEVRQCLLDTRSSGFRPLPSDRPLLPLIRLHGDAPAPDASPTLQREPEPAVEPVASVPAADPAAAGAASSPPSGDALPPSNDAAK